VVLFIAQGVFSGRVPFAPGTAGSLIGVLLWWFLRELTLPWYAAVCAALVVIGTRAAGRAEIILGQKDSPSIVIDEITGFLVAMFLIPPGWGTLAAGFALFRFFDIAKPWPIRRLQEIPGGAGVMADDIVAGIYVNLLLQILAALPGRT
jgi:phosphatidylglycerophosphatase A